MRQATLDVRIPEVMREEEEVVDGKKTGRYILGSDFV